MKTLFKVALLLVAALGHAQGTIPASKISVSLQGGFWAPLGTSHFVAAAANVAVCTGANTVCVIQFSTDKTATIGNASTRIGTGGTIACISSVGFYDASKNLLTQATRTCSSANTIATTALTSTITVAQNTVLYYAFCSNEAIPTEMGVSASSTNVQNTLNDGATAANAQWATAANTCTAGVLPASLGNLTTANFDFPLAYFRP